MKHTTEELEAMTEDQLDDLRRDANLTDEEYEVVLDAIALKRFNDPNAKFGSIEDVAQELGIELKARP